MGSGSVSSSELRAMMASFGENACEADTTMQMFDLDGSGTITKAELLKAVEMMHTFAAGRRDSKRRVITNAAGGLVVVAAELVDDELDTIAASMLRDTPLVGGKLHLGCVEGRPRRFSCWEPSHRGHVGVCHRVVCELDNIYLSIW